MKEKICEYHGGCTNTVHYSGRGKRSPHCDEHKTVVGREKARDRQRNKRDRDRPAKLAAKKAGLPQCCRDWIGNDLRRNACPQHQTWYQIDIRMKITRVETGLGDKHSNAPSKDETTIGDMAATGVRVIPVGDDWWNDKELVFKVKIPRDPDRYIRLNYDTDDALEQSRLAD